MITATAEELGHERAWRALEAELRPFVAGRVATADVDDVLQDVFVRIQRGLGALRDGRRLGPWVYRVARSAVADHLRARARHPLAREGAAEAAAPTIPDGLGADGAGADEGEADAAREMAAYAALFVTFLPSPYREALTLTELEGLTQREAAARAGVSVTAMKSRVRRGREKLRAALEDCCHIALDARRRVVGFERRPDGKLPDGCCI